MKPRTKDTLLLVGDHQSDRSKLYEIFESNYYLLEAETASQAVMLLEQNRQCIAAVLADIPLEKGDEMRALVDTCHTGDRQELPLVALVVPAHTGEREEFAFLLGVDDVVLKPYTTLAIQRRIQVLVDLYLHRWHLEKLVDEQNKTIHHASQTMVDALSAVIEHRNTESGNHVLRIRRFTQILLEEVQRCCPEYALTEQTIDNISSAAALHDIGKISIPDAILNKPDRLTSEEFEIMKTHTTIGSQLVTQMTGMGDEEYLRYSYNISLYHHERWDGKGYPTGLKGEQIPICAQVVGLVDAFDALTTPRVYKPAYPCNQALNMIVNGECGQFSPKLLECFKRVRTQLFELAEQYADGYSPKSDNIRIPLPDPIRQVYRLDANQLSQLKYQTLLHYINDTVLEVDIDHEVYHIVHNPDPDLISRLTDPADGSTARFTLYDGVHPEDLGRVLESNKQLIPELFNHHLRKYSVPFRIFSPLAEDYLLYTMTMLRINTDNPDQRLLLAIFHKEDDPKSTATPINTERLDAGAFYGMTGSTLCCFTDDAITVHHGTETLHALTDYTQEEVSTLFHDSMLAMVVPEDRPLLEALREEQNSNIRSIELRILRKNQEPLWVNCRSRFLIRADGAEYLYLTLVDITGSREKQSRLETVIQRNQTLIDCSESVIFEWDLQTDLISCSDKLQSRFGYTMKNAPFTQQLGDASRFHPDDLPLLRKAVRNLMEAPGTEVVDARIVNTEGRYLWSRIRAVSISTEEKPTHIMGVVYDIDELKSAALSMKRQAERDSLTKLLNKVSVQQAVNTWLEEADETSRGALLILDMDNFKLVNDTHGHLYGDAVLTQIGSTLRSLFRAGDCIGRIGGDEFMIFMKDIPSKELVEERCQLLTDSLNSQLSRLMPGLPVSVSIGAALMPNHGTVYNDLFRNADTALYNAKHKGKSQYKLYDPQIKYDALADAAEMTRIDSDENPVMNNDSLLRFVFRSLYESRDVDATIQELLAFIGARFDVSRVYIFENNDDNTACSNTFEWCNEGISPEKDNLQNISYITDIPGWPEVYDERGVLYCSDVKDLPPTAQEILEPQGVKSMLQCAIMDQGIFRGYVGFDECSGTRLWTQDQVSMLEFFAEVFAVFLLKERALRKKTEDR